MNGLRSAIGRARKAPGTSSSKIRSVRAHAAARRSDTVSAMGSSLGPECTSGPASWKPPLDRRAEADYPRSPVTGHQDAWSRGPMTMRYRAYAYTTEADRRQRLEDDVRRGLTASRKTLPSKYFYDEIGSNLFEEITRVPEYYLTRTE